MKSDCDIREDVIRELEWDPQVSDPEALGVAVEDGAVTLTGSVPTYSEKLAAVRAASRVYGVKAVADELKVRLAEEPRDDSGIARRSPTPWSGARRFPKARCMPGSRAAGCFSEARSSGITSGMRSSGWSGMSGAWLGITNNIVVAPSVSAERVGAAIEEAFRREADIDARHIKVDVVDHTAKLYGHVHSLNEAEVAAAAAASAPASPTSRAVSSLSR